MQRPISPVLRRRCLEGHYEEIERRKRFEHLVHIVNRMDRIGTANQQRANTARSWSEDSVRIIPPPPRRHIDFEPRQSKAATVRQNRTHTPICGALTTAVNGYCA